jgi:hypothetical protein
MHLTTYCYSKDHWSLVTRINLLYSIYQDRKHGFGIEKKWIYRFKMAYFWLGRYCTNQLISLSEFPVIYGYSILYLVWMIPFTIFCNLDCSNLHLILWDHSTYERAVFLVHFVTFNFTKPFLSATIITTRYACCFPVTVNCMFTMSLTHFAKTTFVLERSIVNMEGSRKK